MLVVLSPAKTLDLEPTPVETHTVPEHLDSADKLAKILGKYSVAKIRQLMKVSESIAETNVVRWANYAEPTPDNAKQAILTFAGDTYRDLARDDWSDEDRQFAQDHVRILSGLYGVLRPLDLMYPYRLEMGTRLKTRRGKNLYEFWGQRIAKSLSDALQAQGGTTIVNLASNEYWRAVDKKALGEARVVKADFRERRDGTYKIISFFAKRARGTMTNWIIGNRINNVGDLCGFDVDGYRFAEEMSSDEKLMFVRDKAN